MKKNGVPIVQPELRSNSLDPQKDIKDTTSLEIPIHHRGHHVRSVTAIIRKGETHYIGECVEIDVVTQGTTIDETLLNLKEAVALYFENVRIEDVFLPDESPLLVTIGVDEYVTG